MAALGVIAAEAASTTDHDLQFQANIIWAARAIEVGERTLKQGEGPSPRVAGERDLEQIFPIVLTLKGGRRPVLRPVDDMIRYSVH